MAFASTVSSSTVMGNKRWKFGTFTNGAMDTGGSIITGLDAIDACGVFTTSDVDAATPKFTVSGGTITLVTGSNIDGNWWAVGV